MAVVLVVDDSELDRHVASTLLEEHAGWVTVHAEDGREALALMRRELPDLVLTDLQMPEINGLELVETIRRDYPSVPVILMTAHGSEEIAVAALKKGAASYVPKRNLARDLVSTVENVLSVTLTSRNQEHILDVLEASELLFVLSNDPAHIEPLIGHLQDLMSQMKLVDKSGRIRVGTALHEALANAIEHGNLEVRSELRELDNGWEYQRRIETRRQQLPYRDRCIRVNARFSHNEAVYVIRDEGPGFDPSQLPDPTDPANLEKVSGRGLILIRTFMDEVRFNDTGSQITMIKHGGPPAAS